MAFVLKPKEKQDKYRWPLLFLFSVINFVFVSFSFKEPNLFLIFGVLRYEVYYWVASTVLLSFLYLLLFYKVEKYGRNLRVVKREFYHNNLLTVESLINVMALNISVLIMFYILSLSSIGQVDILGYTKVTGNEINNFHFLLNSFYRGMTFYAFIMPFVVLLRWFVSFILGVIRNNLTNKEKAI